MSPAWTCRQARPEDAAGIAALTDAAYARYIPVLGRRPVPMIWDYARVVAEWQVWVAEEDGNPVGVLLLVPEPDVLLIESIAVAPPAQGRGIGRGLIDLALTEAARQGFGALRLHTNAKMPDNIALYRRCGFAETRRETQGENTVVHMSMDVPVQPGQVGPD